MKSSFFLLGVRFFKLMPWMGNLARFWLLRLLLPLCFFYLKKKHQIEFDVIYRHSVLQKNYNPFLSDIDFTLVIKKHCRVYELVESLKSFSRIFKVIDLPQIYYKEEFAVLPDIDSPQDSDIRFIWYFRKFRWIELKEMSSYENYKKRIAFAKIYSETVRGISNHDNLRTEDLLLNLPSIPGYRVCVYDNYLELKDGKRVLEMTHNELSFLVSLLPGEPVSMSLDQKWINFKKKLWIHEYLLSRSHLRLYPDSPNVADSLDYLRQLEVRYKEMFKEDLVLSGSEYDFIS